MCSRPTHVTHRRRHCRRSCGMCSWPYIASVTFNLHSHHHRLSAICTAAGGALLISTHMHWRVSIHAGVWGAHSDRVRSQNSADSAATSNRSWHGASGAADATATSAVCGSLVVRSRFCRNSMSSASGSSSATAFFALECNASARSAARREHDMLKTALAFHLADLTLLTPKRPSEMQIPLRTCASLRYGPCRLRALQTRYGSHRSEILWSTSNGKQHNVATILQASRCACMVP